MKKVSSRWYLKEYAVLIVAMTIFVVCMYFVPDPFYKKVLAVFAAVFYFIFGVSHHMREKNFSGGIFLEYLLVSALVLIVFLA